MTTVTEPEARWYVTPLNGHPMEVLTAEEARFYDNQRDKYMAENSFTDVSDVSDLDRLIALELQSFRAERFLASGLDYDGAYLTVQATTELRRQVKVLTQLIQEVKTGLGLTRTAREKAQHESVGAYLTNLHNAAKQFGVKREKELITALTLMHELISLVETYDRADQTERGKLGLDSEADLVEWIRIKLIPQFRGIDEHFRRTKARYWVGEL
jgi:hypothetical protein